MLRSSTRLALVLATFAGAAGCSNSEAPPVQIGTSEARLVALAGCGEVEATLRDNARRDVNAYVDAMLAQSVDQACEADDMQAPVTGSAAPNAAATGGGSSSAKASGPSARSGTNVQVAGVDEADFVKSDDKGFLYTAVGNRFEITRGWPANTMQKLSSTEIPGTARKLFVDGERVVVYSSVVPTVEPGMGVTRSNGGASVGSSRTDGGGECSYGYGCTVDTDGTETHVTVFDVRDRTAPTRVRHVASSGSLVAARRIGHTVHTVVAERPRESDLVWSAFDGVRGLGCGRVSDEERESYRARLEAARAKALAAIDALDARAMLPAVADDGAASPVACSGFYRSPVNDATAFTSVLSFDPTEARPVVSSTIIARPGHVYASEDALYFSASYGLFAATNFPSMKDEREVSTLHKFGIGARPFDTHYEASGLVKGHVLNQFAMDEAAGVLRVATSTGQVPDANVHSTLSTLAREGDALVLRGKVDNLAPTEDIRSVRFDGDRAFIVTFKKTDPLYVLDVSKPEAPAVLGELKIPGFSTYMHMMDPTHLLTIGYDAEDHGNFAYFQGVLLQIFDVSNPADPKLAHKETIGTRGTSSEALANHLAFNYFPEKNLLALPMTICEASSGGSSYGAMTFNGLLVYDVTASSGFHLRGKVHAMSSATDGCTNWWSQASSSVKRSLFMDDFVYAVSESRIQVNSLDRLGTDVATVTLGQ